MTTTDDQRVALAQAELQIAWLSQWVDDANAHRDPEARTWGRVAKITEEAGEAIEALIAATGQNPRKANTSDWQPVVEECLDVALTALGAVEHLTGNGGDSFGLLLRKIRSVATRAGMSS